MKITVITVCFNSAAYIADALRSVDMQTWPDLEHIVVDGASRDTTLGVVAAFPKPWRRVVSEPDSGIYDAMNKGIGLATGEIVGFMNSDDCYASSDALENVASVFADPKVQACWGDLCYVKPDDISKIVRYWRSTAFRPGLFRTGWAPPHPSFFVRRSVLDALGGFDLRYRFAADFELMARLLEVHKICTKYLPGVLVRMRTGGATNRSVANILRGNREILAALDSLGLSPSIPSYVLGKLHSRGRQFLVRPAQSESL